MSLTELSYYIRKLFPFAIIFFIMFIILFYILQTFLSVISTRPKNSTVFTRTIFNKISPPIVNNASSSAGLQFTLDTIEGEPVTATQTAKIYFLPPTTTRFGYREKIYLIAKTLGFNTDEVKHELNGKVATFQDDTKTLKIDITNFNYSFEFDYTQDPTIFDGLLIPPKDRIEDSAVDFLKSIGRYPEELAQGKINVVYFNYNPEENKLYVTQKPQEANVVEVDFYRPDISAVPEPIPIVSPKYFTSQNHVLMVFNESGYRILKAQVEFYERSYEQIGIYPLKTGLQAWEELKVGRGLVINNDNPAPDILVKKMFLGYYDPDTYQEYLQPVYVFLGDNNFVSYIPAVSSDYFGN